MAQKFNQPWISTVTPGAYSNTTVISNPVGLGSSGNVVIIGEASGGPSFKEVALKDNSFTPDQLDKVSELYISGPIVDAFRAFSAPSNDADIVGSANRIWIVKTNTSTKASATIDTDYGTISDKNFGADGNKNKITITQIENELSPRVSGETIAAFGAALDGATFDIRLNGGAVASVTLSANPADHATIADLVTELNTLLPVGIVASEGAAQDSLHLEMADSATANRDGFGRSFELIDSTPGDLAALGLDSGLTVSAQEPIVEISVVRSDLGIQEVNEIASDIAFAIGYEGTTATMTINKTTNTLTTMVTGGSGANLSINLKDFRTVADLTTYINTQVGYSAIASASVQQLPTSALDSVTAIGIAGSTAVRAGRVKKSAFDVKRALDTSSRIEFAQTAAAGVPNPAAPFFLTGGSKGGTSSADIVDAIEQCAGININMMVPLFSRDATEDIVDSLTESSSTYTIDAIHALVKNHCIQYSTPKLKKNRIAFLSYWGSYSDSKDKAQTLANFRCSMAMQRVSQVDAFGNTTSFLPWYASCVAAGMQAGGFYKAIVNKYANVLSFTDPEGFDSGSPGDVEDALEAGLLFLTQDTAGNRWVSDQTTYGFDTNFVYNSIQATYAADLVAIDLTDSYQRAFIGKSLADVDAATAMSFLSQKMAGYRSLKLIAGSDDAPLGFKNAKVQITAPEMIINVEIKLATALYFIGINIAISAIQSSAE